MTYWIRIKPILKILFISGAIVSFVTFYHFIPAYYLFGILVLLLIIGFFKSVSNLFILIAFAAAIMTTMPNVLITALRSATMGNGAHLSSTIFLVSLIGCLGGRCTNVGFNVQNKSLHFLGLLTACFLAAFIFNRQLIYEPGLFYSYLLLISVISVFMGGSIGIFEVKIHKRYNAVFILILIAVFISSNYLIKRPVKSVALLECFNSWATSRGEYSLEKMSLESGYSYSLARNLLEHRYSFHYVKDRNLTRLTLDRVNAAVMITPTVPLTPFEREAVLNFVQNGGRLILIADHTDLYGHARVINSILEGTGVRVNYDALFVPNEPYAKASVANMPLYSLRPKTPCSVSTKTGFVFGWVDNWISESADYTRPNFFGKLQWTADDSKGNWPIGAITQYGKGFIVIWADSTIFANFCLFQPGIIQFFGSLLEGGEILGFLSPYSFWLLLFSIVCLLLPYKICSRITVFCALGLIVLSGSYYLWDSAPDKFYPADKKIDVYGKEALFDEPPPKYAPREGQMSSAYSHIARSGLWPLYRGEKPKSPVTAKTIWITSWDEASKTDNKVLQSLWGVVINDSNEDMERIGFTKTNINNEIMHPAFKKYFRTSPNTRQIFVTKDKKHTALFNGTSVFASEGVITDRYLGDWWITTEISPFRQYMIKEWLTWLNNRKDISSFSYPEIGIFPSNKGWQLKFETKDLEKAHFSAKAFNDHKKFVYFGSGIWALYERNKEGEFLIGGPETSDDWLKTGYSRWAARSLSD